MPLNRVLASCGAIVLTLSCAGAGPPVSISPNALTASSDSAASAFARRLTLWGFTAAQQDSGGTTIIKGSLRLPHGRKLAGHPFGYWADCGKQFALSRASTADEMRIEISVAVDSVADPYETGVQSRAHAEAVFTGIDRQAVGDPTVGCSSRGLLEQALLNAGHGQWKKPESPPPLTGEVPYTLSPRPGDSLSLPVAEDPRFAYPASLETCAWDSLDQPYLQGQGEVAYAVTAQGIPDTATLTIRTLHGVDTGTFQRAARRLVAHCRFHPRPLASGESTGLVRQRLFFGASEVLGGSYKFPGDVFISHGSPVDSLSQLEEATVILCPRLGPGLPPGRVELQFVVGVDGKPEPSTMQAVNATSPALASVAPGLVMACRFRPARWKGRPVRSAIILPMRVGP